jgi:hypothetical protein
MSESANVKRNYYHREKDENKTLASYCATYPSAVLYTIHIMASRYDVYFPLFIVSP